MESNISAITATYYDIETGQLKTVTVQNPIGVRGKPCVMSANYWGVTTEEQARDLAYFQMKSMSVDAISGERNDGRE